MEREKTKSTEQNIGVLYKVGATAWWGASSLVMGAIYGAKYLATTAINTLLYVSRNLWKTRQAPEQVTNSTPDIDSRTIQTSANKPAGDSDGFTETELYAPGLGVASEVGIEGDDYQTLVLGDGVGFISKRSASSSALPATTQDKAPPPAVNISTNPGVLERIWSGLRRRTTTVEQGRN
jgi:hypothetical protein